MRALLLTLSLVVLAGCASGERSRRAPETPLSAQAMAGQAYAQGICSRCHEIGRHGRSPNPASTPFRVIANRYTDVELSRRLADLETGHYRMPPLVVSEAQLQSLIAYLRTLRAEPERRRPG